MDDEIDLRGWLTEQGLGEYADVLESHHIDFDVILDCTDADFKELGIPLGGRKRLLSAVEELQGLIVDPGTEPVPEPTVVPAFTPEPVTVPPEAPLPPAIPASPPAKIAPRAHNGRKASALLIAAAVHVVIIIVATLMVILPPSKDEAEIVATLVGPPNSVKQEMKKKTVQKQVKRNPATQSAAAAPMALLMKANAVARFTAPDVKKISTGPLGMGEGDLGDSGFGMGTGLSGAASGAAAFFGSSSSGNRFLFVLDHSASMRPNQIELRNKELDKALKGLKGAQYQVLLFAGPALYAEKGWTLAGRNMVKGPNGKTYEFTNKGAADFDFVGKEEDLPVTKWLTATPANIKKTMQFVLNIKKFYGTDWGMALEIAHVMDPKPDVIFFMADGTGGNKPEPILKHNKSNGRPVINMVAMQTKAGAQQFAEVAKGTKGKFTIVDKDGKPIDGFDFIKNPNKYKDRL